MTIRTNGQIIAGGSGSGITEWGDIDGTLSDQTDLQNALNAKANDTDVVKLTGNQTIAGNKTFTDTVRTYQNGMYVRPLEFKNIAVTDNANPASDVSTELAMIAGTSNVNGYLGSFGFQQQADGYHNTYMRVGNSTSGTFVEGRLGIQIASDGTAYGYAPTPATSDNSTKIATTAFVKAQGYIGSTNLVTCHVVTQTYVNGTSWYRVYDDGFIEQGGISTQSSGSSYSTVTFLKAFNNSNYTIVVSQQSSNSSYPMTNFAAYYNKTATTVKIGNRATNSENALNQSWYACGY